MEKAFWRSQLDLGRQRAEGQTFQAGDATRNDQHGEEMGQSLRHGAGSGEGREAVKMETGLEWVEQLRRLPSGVAE